MRFTWSYGIRIIGFVGMVNAIAFLLIELAWAEVISSYAQSHENVVVLMVLGGFLLSAILSGIVSFLGAESVKNKNTVIIAILLGFLINSILWILISYIGVLSRFPEILRGVPGLQKIVVIGRVMMTFAIYILPNFTLLWLISGFTFVIIYVVLLKLFRVELVRNPKKNSGTFW